METVLIANLRAILKNFGPLYLYEDLYNNEPKEVVNFFEFLNKFSKGIVDSEYIRTIQEYNFYIDENYVLDLAEKVLNLFFVFSKELKKENKILEISGLNIDLYNLPIIRTEDIMSLLEFSKNSEQLFYYFYILLLYLLLKIVKHNTDAYSIQIALLRKDILEKIEKAKFFW